MVKMALFSPRVREWGAMANGMQDSPVRGQWGARWGPDGGRGSGCSILRNRVKGGEIWFYYCCSRSQPYIDQRVRAYDIYARKKTKQRSKTK